MKYIFTLFLALLFNTFAFCQSVTCDSSLWKHVYHSYRLKVHQQCMTVTGIIRAIVTEADGDLHVRLQLDSGQSSLLNSYNYSGQYGYLVCEPICVNKVTQTDAIASCKSFINNVKVPKVGTHVSVTGSYVTDTDHGWNEIHPVTKIDTFVVTGVSEEDQYEKISVYPNPSQNYVNFVFGDAGLKGAQLNLYSPIGQLLQTIRLTNEKAMVVNISRYSSGIYHYNIVSEKGNVLKQGHLEIKK